MFRLTINKGFIEKQNPAQVRAYPDEDRDTYYRNSSKARFTPTIASFSSSPST